MRDMRRALEDLPAFALQVAIAGKEMSWRASVETESWPMSSVGKKPFGIAANSDGRHDRGEEDQEHGEAEAQAKIEEHAVARLHPVEAALEQVLRRGAVPIGRQARREHRRQRQRDQRRGDDGDRHDDGEFVEDAPDDAAHEQHRDEHRDERDGDRDDGEADLAASP